MMRWYYPAAGVAALIAAWFAFRKRETIAGAAGAAGAAVAKWTGDGRALQVAINAALSAARASGIVGVPKALTVDGRPGAMTCRAAQWLLDNRIGTARARAIEISLSSLADELRSFVASDKCGGGAPRAPCGISGPVASDAVKKSLLDAIEKRGYPRAQGDRTVRRESNWHPMAVACMGADKHPVAGGLLQFIGVALKSVGFVGSPDQFAALSGEQQLPYLLKFVSTMPRSKLGRPGEFGLALFVPGFVDKPESTIIYDVGSQGWEQNKGLRTPGDGPITVGSVLKTTA